MNKSLFVGGIVGLFLVVFIFGAAAILFGKNSAQAETAPVLANNNVKPSCGCGAKSACGGNCQAGACKCGSGCGMQNK